MKFSLGSLPRSYRRLFYLLLSIPLLLVVLGLVYQLGMLCLEALLEERDQEDREDEEDEHRPGELDQDDVGHHDGARPLLVPAVAGGGERLGGPFDAVAEGALLALEVQHAELVDQAQHDQQQRDGKQQVEEPPVGARE